MLGCTLESVFVLCRRSPLLTKAYCAAAIAAEIVEAGAIAPLVAMLHSKADNARANAAGALENLAINGV